MLLIFLSGCGSQDKAAHPKNDSAPAAKPVSQEPQDTSEPTTAPSPTIVYKDGTANITLFRTLSATTSNSGTIASTVEGTMPITIIFNKDKKVWEVKGSSNRGVGTTEFINPECDCSATWYVDFTVSGVLVPMGGLIAEPDDGCYIQVYINENWERYDAACNCTMGKAVAEAPPEQMYFGPMKMYLVENFEIGENQSAGNAMLISRWLLKDLDIPIATGCMAGDPGR